jgi:hypothetical protein
VGSSKQCCECGLTVFIGLPVSESARRSRLNKKAVAPDLCRDPQHELVPKGYAYEWSTSCQARSHGGGRGEAALGWHVRGRACRWDTHWHVICCGVNPAGGCGQHTSKLPRVQGRWYPSIGGRVPKFSLKGGGQATTGNALFLRRGDAARGTAQ